MRWLRRFTFLILIAAGLTVIYVAIHVFWNVRPYDYVPAASDSQVQIISDRLVLYSRQAEEVARLVAILLCVSGLYTIAQAILSQLAAERVLHRLDSTIDSTRNEFALAAGDLRELKEDVTRAVERATAQTAAMEELRADVRQRLGLAPYPAAPAPAEQPAAADDTPAVATEPESTRIPEAAERDSAGEEPAAAEVHDPYLLACHLAKQGAADPGNRDALYAEAVAQLRAAAAIGSGHVEKNLFTDIEEGGPLFALANTPPYAAELLDLLMNVSVA